MQDDSVTPVSGADHSSNFYLTDHALIGRAAAIPIDAAAPVISVSPVVLSSPGRAVDLQVRVSAPMSGRDLPILLLSHGHGQSNNLASSNGYGPIANFCAAHGFVVIQPTHLSSKVLSLGPETPGAPFFWRSRVEDMKRILDQLAAIETSVPGLSGRMNRSRVAAVGHSMGGHTVSMLLGAQLRDEDGSMVRLAEPRIKAGVLLAAPGGGGASLAGMALKIPFMQQPSFAEMTTPTLVVVGDRDVNPNLTARDANWHADPYTLSPGPKCMFTLVGGEHLLGGVSGYDAAETTDENPERVATIQRLTWAYLRSALYSEDDSWSVACAALGGLEELGRIECK